MRKLKIDNNKQKFTMEFEIKSSPTILYPYLSTASGLEGWFADKVTLYKDDYIFHWGHLEERARIVARKENHTIKYHWITDGKQDESYFQFEIVQDEITGDVALIVTDYAPDGEQEENIRLWNSQVHQLMHLIGS